MIGSVALIASAVLLGEPLGAGILTVSLIAALGLLALWWLREHRLALGRQAMRRIHRLGEQITADRSSEEILRRLRDSLPESLSITNIDLFLYSRTSGTLNEVAEGSVGLGPIIPPDRADGSLESALAASFRNRSLCR